LNKDKRKRNQILNIDQSNQINRYDNDCEFQFIPNSLDKMGYLQLDGNMHISGKYSIKNIQGKNHIMKFTLKSISHFKIFVEQSKENFNVVIYLLDKDKNILLNSKILKGPNGYDTISLIDFIADQGEYYIIFAIKDLISGGWISVFITSYLSYLALNGLGKYSNKLRTIRRTTHPAIEVEKVFDDDKKDLKDWILDFYTSRYPKVTGNELLVKYDKLGENEKKIMEREIRDKIREYVDSRRKGYYGSSLPLDLSIARDPEKLLEYMKNNKPSYRYYGNDVYNILDYLGESEFKRIAATCTFS
jgi:hypothetical protein